MDSRVGHWEHSAAPCRCIEDLRGARLPLVRHPCAGADRGHQLDRLGAYSSEQRQRWTVHGDADLRRAGRERQTDAAGQRRAEAGADERGRWGLFPAAKQLRHGPGANRAEKQRHRMGCGSHRIRDERGRTAERRSVDGILQRFHRRSRQPEYLLELRGRPAGAGRERQDRRRRARVKRQPHGAAWQLPAARVVARRLSNRYAGGPPELECSDHLHHSLESQVGREPGVAGPERAGGGSRGISIPSQL